MSTPFRFNAYSIIKVSSFSASSVERFLGWEKTLSLIIFPQHSLKQIATDAVDALPISLCLTLSLEPALIYLFARFVVWLGITALLIMHVAE